MEKLYLVTGGTGFIGSALVKRLVEGGGHVRVVDNDLRGRSDRLSPLRGRFEPINADVRDPEAMTAACRGVHTILHLAALNGTGNFYRRPELVLDVGVKGMLAMLEAARACQVETFVLASSSEAYQTPSRVPTTEAEMLKVPDPWNARYSYGGSKIISEIMLANYNRDLFRRAMIFRPHNVYGPDMGEDHVLPQFIRRAHDLVAAHPDGPVPFPIQGDGSDTRSFIFIDDFIDGVICMLARGEHRNIYNIGTQDERSIGDVARIVVKWFGREAHLEAGPRPVGGTSRRCPDIAKLAGLGFKPAITLADGIARTAPWYAGRSADGSLRHAGDASGG